jgi:DNA invertase Pin-like site-specific DNA recombinase
MINDNKYTDNRMNKTGYYMRVSTYLQKTERQDEKVEQGWKLYKDKGVSGKIPFNERPQGQQLLNDIKLGLIDEVKVLHLDRLGRSTEDVLMTIRTFHEYGVSIHIIKQGIHTLVDGKENFTTKLLITILTSISEMEFNLHRERIMDGIRIGVLKGNYKGRVKGSTESLDSFSKKPNVQKVKTLLENGVPVRKIRDILGVSFNFCYKVRDRLLTPQLS